MSTCAKHHKLSIRQDSDEFQARVLKRNYAILCAMKKQYRLHNGSQIVNTQRHLVSVTLEGRSEGCPESLLHSGFDACHVPQLDEII
jgi:hypothetical protein